MQVNMNGLRSELTNNVKDMRELLSDELTDIPFDIQCQLNEKFDQIIQSVNILNCVFDPDDNKDFSDMSTTHLVEPLIEDQD